MTVPTLPTLMFFSSHKGKITRNKKDPSITNNGMSHNDLVAYTSIESHYSILRAASIIGIGKDNIRLIDVDENGKMNLNHLKQILIQDLNSNKIPFFINATASSPLETACTE